MKRLEAEIGTIDRLLLDCLHRDSERIKVLGSVSLTENEWHQFFLTAVRKRVSALIFYRLKKRDALGFLPKQIEEGFRNRYLMNAARNLKLSFELRNVLEAFLAENISSIVLKGAHLVNWIYENPALREMSDIDLMLHPEQMKLADKILSQMGYRPRTPWDLACEMENFRHLPVYTKRSSIPIELHFNIFQVASSFYVGADELWPEKTVYQNGGLKFNGLSPELLLVHICVHLAGHRYAFGLHPLCDISELIFMGSKLLNWEKFSNKTIKMGYECPVFLSLFLAKELLGAQVPEGVLQSLEFGGINERIFEIAQRQILAERHLKDFGITVAETLENEGLFSKIRTIFKRLFLPRKMIAREYGLRPNSKLFFLYYPRRFWDLIHRQRKKFWKHMHGDLETKAEVKDYVELDRWLNVTDKR
jgi:hypothetical protein